MRSCPRDELVQAVRLEPTALLLALRIHIGLIQTDERLVPNSVDMCVQDLSL